MNNIPRAIVRINLAGDGYVKWQETRELNADEYHDVLKFVNDTVRSHSEAVRKAWDNACASGLAPDADKDIYGWRVINLKLFG